MIATIDEAKRRLPLPELMKRLGLGQHAMKSARCPFHDDKHNSFSVWQQNGVWRWKCHVGCGCGDEINFLELHESLSRRDATKRFLELAGVNGADPIHPSANARPMNAEPKTLNWDSCVDAF